MTRSRTRATLRPLPAAALGVTAAVGFALLLSPGGSTSALWRAVDTAPVPALTTGGLVVELDLLEAPDALDAPLDAETTAPQGVAPEADMSGTTADRGSATDVPAESGATEGAPDDAPALDSLEPSTGTPADQPFSTTHGTRTP